MGERLRIDAYVVEADAPAPRQLIPMRPTIVVVYRAADGRLLSARDTRRLPEERWIVRGMTIPVLIDPAKPHRAEVLVDEIPPLDQRVAACDPTLCRLEEVARHVYGALNEMGVHEGLDLADEDGREIDAMRKRMLEIHTGGVEADHAAAAAARPQAPEHGTDGRLRGTADLVSSTMRPRDGSSETVVYTWRGKRIVRVWLYGHEPYPIVEEVKFDVRDPRTRLAYGRVPVSVSPTDRTDVRYLWDEYDLDGDTWVQERVGTEVERAVRDASAIKAEFAGPMVEQAMAACHGVEQRRILAGQLRAMGQEVPDHHLRDTERLAKLDALLARGVIDQAEYDEQAARC